MRWALYNLTATTAIGGAEILTWNLARALAARGEEVVVIGGQGPYVRRVDGVDVWQFPYRPRDSFPDLGSRARKLMERLSMAPTAAPALRAGGFDAVVIFKPYDMAPVLWATRGGRGRVALWSGGAEFFPSYRSLARRIHCLAAVSAFHARQIARYTGLKVRVIYPGLDYQIFRPSAPEPTLAEAAGIGKGEVVAVCSARLVALKGIHHAIAALAAAGENLRLVVAGTGEWMGRLKAMARAAGVERRVVFLGALEQRRLPGLYALADMALVPSTGEEALGLSAAEAMACGVAVVASRLGGLEELVDGAGVLVPPGQPLALSWAIKALAASPELRKALGRAGQRRVRRMLSWDRALEALKEGLWA